MPTLLDGIALAEGCQSIDLDDGATRAAVSADPALLVSGPSPVCLDEYQHEPELLSAIKAELNRDLRPGRFVLTSSTTYASVPLTAQSLTGRLHVVTVWPLSRGEIGAAREVFVEQLFSDSTALVQAEASRTSREDYVERVVRGGTPSR